MAQAAIGLPAHATVLYPFIAPERLGRAVRASLAEVAGCMPRDDPAWRSLPHPGVASSIEVIARLATGPWRTVWRIPLGGRAAPARR